MLATSACQAQSLSDRAGNPVKATDVRPPTAAVLAGTDTRDYVIGPEDILAVNVWKEPEISRNVPVRPDGKISLPLIGDIEASGFTPTKLQGDIKKRLEAYMTDPEVTVIVQEVKSLKFNIVGEIAKPGSYALSQSMTVLDAIALAGGLRDFAKQKEIYILRVSDKGSHFRMPFNYKDVIKGKKGDLELQPRDTVVVP